jgi:Holliday junction resolvasome RuvABC endonuclease subunit
MLILGIDPGPTEIGYAVLRRDTATRRGSYVDAGKFAVDARMCDELFGLVKVHGIGAVGVELPGRLHPDRNISRAALVSRSNQLLATVKIQERIVGWLNGFGFYDVHEVTASDWRRGIVGRSSPSDAAIKVAIMRQVAGWPKRSNEHERDAAGVALATFNKARGSRREEVV